MPDNAAPVLILTRPRDAARRFLADLGPVAEGIEVIESPVLDIRQLDPEVPASDWAALILTSENGAAAAARMGLPPGLRAWCVGERTAAAARAAGFVPVTSAGGDAESLIAAILEAADRGPFLHVRGEHAAVDVGARLAAHGIACGQVIAYAQEELPLSSAARAALGGKRPVVLPVFSPRTAALICEQAALSAPLQVVAISAAAARPFRCVAGAAVTVAERPDGPAMARATAAAIRRPGPG